LLLNLVKIKVGHADYTRPVKNVKEKGLKFIAVKMLKNLKKK
jgi:hypothetical protein